MNYQEYGNRLCPDDALSGRNFVDWPGMLEAVSRRFPIGDKKLYSDMLASDHIPFNLFVPLKNHAVTTTLLRDWTGLIVDQVTAIEIEWAPGPKSEFLDDKTSFDVFITFRVADGSRGAVGIEVKYTEREYDWGTSERERMFDPRSLYLEAHGRSGLYTDASLELLRTKRLKQLWCNQLLGESMLQHPTPQIDHFTSVLIYPSGNEHFVQASSEYEQLLLSNSGRVAVAFYSLTYERFIEQCRRGAALPGDQSWLAYLAARYIIS